MLQRLSRGLCERLDVNEICRVENGALCKVITAAKYRGRSIANRELEMRTKFIITCAVTSAILVTGSEATTQNIIENVDDWTIVSVSQPYSEIDPLCILKSPSIDGTFLQISNPLYKRSSARGNALFFIYTSKFISNNKKEYLPSKISIDRKNTWYVNLYLNKIKEEQSVISGIIDDRVDRAIELLSSAEILELTIKPPKGIEHSFSINLKGSSKALSAYKECLRKVRIAPD